MISLLSKRDNKIKGLIRCSGYEDRTIMLPVLYIELAEKAALICGSASLNDRRMGFIGELFCAAYIARVCNDYKIFEAEIRQLERIIAREFVDEDFKFDFPVRLFNVNAKMSSHDNPGVTISGGKMPVDDVAYVCMRGFEHKDCSWEIDILGWEYGRNLKRSFRHHNVFDPIAGQGNWRNMREIFESAMHPQLKI